MQNHQVHTAIYDINKMQAKNETTKEIPMDRIELKWNSKRKINMNFYPLFMMFW